MGDVSFIKKYCHDFSSMADLDISLGNYRGYYAVTVTAEWTGLSAADGTIEILERADSTLTWNTIPGLSFTMLADPGSQDFTDGAFHAGEIGVRIAKVSNAAGVVSFYVTAKTE